MKLIKKTNYTPAPEGTHEAEIYKMNEVTNKFSGNPQLQIIFKIVDKEGCSPLVDWFNPVLDPKAKIYKLIQALGLKIDSFTKEVDFEEFVGRKIRITVTHKEKRGMKYANITKYEKPIATY